MGFHTSSSNYQPSSPSYGWVSQPRRFPGQHPNRVGHLDGQTLGCDQTIERMTLSKQVLELFKSVFSQKLSATQQSIHASQPTHQ